MFPRPQQSVPGSFAGRNASNEALNTSCLAVILAVLKNNLFMSLVMKMRLRKVNYLSPGLCSKLFVEVELRTEACALCSLRVPGKT
jgi:hypothetical protein